MQSPKRETGEEEQEAGTKSNSRFFVTTLYSINHASFFAFLIISHTNINHPSTFSLINKRIKLPLNFNYYTIKRIILIIIIFFKD